MRIFFTVPGTPVAKGRARARIAQGKSGKQFVAMYNPKETSNFENKVLTFFREKYVGNPLEGAVGLIIKAYFPIPQSWPKKKKEAAIGGVFPVTVKPDVDNVAKSILDGLNTVAFADDKQVAELSVSKYYSLNPRTEIEITN